MKLGSAGGVTAVAELSHRGLVSAQISPLIAELILTMIFCLNEPKGQGKVTVKSYNGQTKGLDFGGTGWIQSK